MNLRDVGSETSANDTVQTNKRYHKKMLKCNKNNCKSTKRL
jgi:hypothetical protein